MKFSFQETPDCKKKAGWINGELFYKNQKVGHVPELHNLGSKGLQSGVVFFSEVPSLVKGTIIIGNTQAEFHRYAKVCIPGHPDDPVVLQYRTVYYLPPDDFNIEKHLVLSKGENLCALLPPGIVLNEYQK